jgi:hypothetical protein
MYASCGIPGALGADFVHESSFRQPSKTYLLSYTPQVRQTKKIRLRHLAESCYAIVQTRSESESVSAERVFL